LVCKRGDEYQPTEGRSYETLADLLKDRQGVVAWVRQSIPTA